MDIVLVVGFILELETPNPDQFYIADLNQDFSLNVVDVILIVGLILSE